VVPCGAMRPSLSSPTLLLLASAAALACQPSNPYGTGEKPDPGPPPKVVGVHPEDFDCEAFLPPAEVAAVAMGEVVFSPSGFRMPTGVPKPCTYFLREDESRSWGVALDCRKRAPGDVDRTIAAHAGKEDAAEVAVGRKGIDHSGLQLTFLDDDTDCSVTITGPDDVSRAALGRVVALRLTRETAPKRPRAVSE
jgi:hypothetical protein